MGFGRTIVGRLLPACLVLGLLTLAPSGKAGAQPLETVRVQAHWLEQFEFAGFYVAKEHGFYEDVGLAVEFLPHRVGETDVVVNVVSGEAEYGVNYSSLLADYFQGTPVVALAAIFQKSPLVLLARKTPGLEDASGLKGRRIMIGGDALDSAPIMALLFSHNLRADDIQRLPHSHDVADLIDGKTDAMTAYIGNEPFQMAARGADYQIFDPGSTGLSFYENILFTSAKEARDHPERVDRFREATLKGFVHAFTNIEDTAALIHEKYNEQRKSLDALVFEGRELRGRALVGETPLGSINPTRLTELANAFRLMGVSLADKPIADFIWDGARDATSTEIRFTAAERSFIRATEIQVATTTNWHPFAFVDRKSGTVAGIGYDFWREIAGKAGLNYTITPYEAFSRELQDLADKRQDVIFSVGATPARRQYAFFSQPYASFPLAIATSKDENFIPDVSQLKGRKIAIGRNFTAHRTMLQAYPDLDYLPRNNVRDGLQAVSSGEAYAFIDIMPVLVDAINRHGFTNLKISGDTGLTFDLRIMVRDDFPELVSIADKVIAAIPDSRRQEIMQRWINVKYERGFDVRTILPWVAGGGVPVLLLFAWLFHLKQQAERANRMKSEFLALMSHDLRTPLNAIMGFSDIMRSEALGPIKNPRYREYAADIHRSGELLVSLINDILDLSKVEAGKYELAEQDIVVSAVVEQGIRGCGVLATPRGIAITAELPDSLPQLRGDERVLTQIVNNLLSNAIKFSEDNGIIRITAETTASGGMELRVIDNGMGMSSNDIAQVTKPFQQLNREKARRIEGTGLGLHLCQSFMRLMSGDLRIESEVGKGTSVTLGFPPERVLAPTQ